MRSLLRATSRSRSCPSSSPRTRTTGFAFRLKQWPWPSFDTTTSSPCSRTERRRACHTSSASSWTGARWPNGSMAVGNAVLILTPVASALDYAHSQGVLHRDIKPSNIMLLSDGTPVLTDFGLAKVVGGETITVTGQVLGTPEYMAPELVSGDGAGPAADRYSLAVVAYQMLTGRVPFQGNTPGATLMAQMNDPLPPARELNPGLSEGIAIVLHKGLAKTPEERYESASDFVAALAASEMPASLEAG